MVMLILTDKTQHYEKLSTVFYKKWCKNILYHAGKLDCYKKRHNRSKWLRLDLQWRKQIWREI